MTIQLQWPTMEWDFFTSLPLMPCRNASRQSICFLQTTWRKRRGHALMLNSPRAGVVFEWEGIERWERYWICSKLCWMIFFFPICPDFCFYLFCWHACRNVVRAQVTLLAGLVWCSVLHWSNFRTPPPHPSHTLSCTTRVFILNRIHVKQRGEGGRRWRWGNPLFVFLNACWDIIQL